MFSDLKKGFQVHTLDTNTVPKYELGKVVAVSEPRYLPPQPGQYQAMQTRVVDLKSRHNKQRRCPSCQDRGL